MISLKTTTAVSLTLGALTLSLAGAIALPATASAQANCDWYAKTSLQQQQENEQKKCGFTGPAWSTDLRAHMTWCTTANPDLWKAEAQKRQQMLAGCKK
jgi:hypothetical protein